MGCTVSAEERAAIARTKQIDQKLRLEASKKHKDIKLLLLGNTYLFLYDKNLRSVACHSINQSGRVAIDAIDSNAANRLNAHFQCGTRKNANDFRKRTLKTQLKPRKSAHLGRV